MVRFLLFTRFRQQINVDTIKQLRYKQLSNKEIHMTKKYELTDETVECNGRKLFRIQAINDFGSVRAGDLGGYIESEYNLCHDGDAWVYGYAQVYGNAQVSGDAQVYGDAWVYGDAQVYGDAHGR
jgi:hypothetical protein